MLLISELCVVLLSSELCVVLLSSELCVVLLSSELCLVLLSSELCVGCLDLRSPVQHSGMEVLQHRHLESPPKECHERRLLRNSWGCSIPVIKVGATRFNSIMATGFPAQCRQLGRPDAHGNRMEYHEDIVNQNATKSGLGIEHGLKRQDYKMKSYAFAINYVTS